MNEKPNPNSVAVIGMGCWYPGADNPKKLWTNILGRRRQFRRLPDCRLPLQDYYHKDKTTVDKSYARMAAVIDGFDFDWTARRIPRSTYQATDIVHWLALETVLQAIADAGFTEQTLPGKRTGVIVGNSLTGEYSRSYNLRLRWPYVRKALLRVAHQCNLAPEEVAALEEGLEADFKSAFPAFTEDSLAGGLSNTIAGRICNYFNLDGGGYTVDGACSSSLLAIATAAAGLCAKDLDLALAGGVDISLDPFEMVGFSKTGALTDGEMNVYDRRASGFIPGEGCGFVVLKRHADALKDGNPIYAVIRGWGISSDGSNAAITAPSVPGQSLALKRAYERAPYGIDQLDFIEGHGTGTVVGDRVELEAIASLMGEDTDIAGEKGRFLGITSLKSIVGHTKAASGVGGFIKAVIAVNRRICPPMAGCRYPNRAFDESARHVFPIRIGKCLPSTETLRVGVSAMGFGGINSHITVESAGPPSTRFQTEMDERTLMASAQESELFIVSADSAHDLVERCRQLVQEVDGLNYAETTDLAASLADEVKSEHPWRVAFLAGSPDELVDTLRNLESFIEANPLAFGKTLHHAAGRIWLGHTGGSPRIGFLFPGQGSQRLNMARLLVERFEWARALVAQADRLAGECGATFPSEVMFPPDEQILGEDRTKQWFDELSLTANAQPAICLASVLWHRYLSELGIVPVAVGGHSLGEATAFFASGAFDETTLLRFAFRRGQAMSTRPDKSGTMIGLGCSQTKAKRLLENVTDGYVALANINAPNQMVAAGESDAIEQLRRLAEDADIPVRRLPVSNAFHCRLTAPAAEKLTGRTALPAILKTPTIRLFSGMDGKEIVAGHDLADHFVRQVTARVNFMALAESIAGCTDLLIEVGPGRVLCGLVDATLSDSSAERRIDCLPTEVSAFQTDDLNGLLARLFVSGTTINWKALYANRPVYPFVPPSRRAFFSNPCENSAGEAATPISSSLTRALSQGLLDLPGLSGLSPETANAYLKKRGAFLKDLIEVDLKHAITDQTLSPHATHDSPVIESAAADENSAIGNRADRPDLEQLYDLVETITGFPKQTLVPDARLLDDLNLDSIKSGDLIARYAERFDLTGKIDPAQWTNASLGEIADHVARRFEDRSDTATDNPMLTTSDVLPLLVDQMASITGVAAAQISTESLVGPDLHLSEKQLLELLTATANSLRLELNIDPEPLQHRSLAQIADIFIRMANATNPADPLATLRLPRTTVRELRIDVIESPLPALPSWYGKRREDQWSNARVLILADDADDSVCRALNTHLIRQGAGVSIKTFDALESGKTGGDSEDFSHFIAILPRVCQDSDLTENRLRKMIRRLSFAALPPPASHGPRRRNCLVFVQFGGGYFGTVDNADYLDQCCATALAKSVYLERDDLKMRVIDFDPGIDANRIAEKTILEIRGPQNFVEAGYDHHLTRRTTVASAIEPTQHDPTPTTWSKEDVILVTGGAKGITAECALALARTVGAKMALVGRSPIHTSRAGDGEEDPVSRTLRRYERHGLSARYYRCDVCDKEAVAQTIRQVQRELGPITGVIHGAGQNTPRRFSQVSPEEALQEVGPKVIGILNLISQLEDQPTRLIVGLTSIIGITGMQGNGWYAFSNEALDLILRRFGSTHPETRTLSVAYSIWRDEGMGARLGSVAALKRKGIEAIPTKEGVDRFLRLFLFNPGTHQVLVAARIMQLDTLGIPTRSTVDGARFLERRVHFIPGVESAFLVHLSLEEDLYLEDHCYEGAYLFPAVFGLEAMAQVVAHVTGVTGFTGLTIENIKLRRPIIVDAKSGADIVIWAQTRERSVAGEELAVEAGIFKVDAESDTEFFSATFVMGTMERPDAAVQMDPFLPLAMDPTKDLYRDTLLFQGPRFQRMDCVYQLERTADHGTVVVGTPPEEPDSASLAFATQTQRNFLLGDPFLRDNLLQSAALLIPQDTSLPLSIRRWEIAPMITSSSGKNRRLIRTRLLGIQDQEVETAVETLDESGGIVERLTGYRLKILKHHDDYPTVADFLNPDDRDTQMVQDRIAGVSAPLRVKVPAIRVTYLPGLHDLSKEQRRERVETFVEQSVAQWGRQNGMPDCPVRIGWKFSGKPEAWILNDPVDVSVTHDDRYCLVAVGSCSLGCDLSPVTHRSASQWAGLLGPLGRRLLDDQKEGPALDRHGTAFWSAREVLQKMGVQETIFIDFEAPTPESLLFTCTTDKGLIKVLTVWMVLTLGEERVVALSLTDLPTAITAEQAPCIDYSGYESLFNQQHYKIIAGGPQGQGIFVYRFPVTFMPAGQLSRNVYYSHYFFWAGTARETSAWPVLRKIADQFATGQWGGVTNYADLTILGEATTHDLIEVWLWASGNGGAQNAVLDLTFDFRKLRPDGTYQRLAWLEQQTTWVRILDHGVAKVEPYPDYYGRFLDDMLPRYEAPNLPEPIAEPLRPLFAGEGERELFRAQAGPIVKPTLLTQWMDTCLEDANIVGNIYFANYYAWQGRVRDRYFYDLIPDHFKGTGEKGELICLNCRVDHLREAMPFDRIEVRMALKKLKECRATLHFEYYKPDHSGKRMKLATGKQEVVWVRRDKRNTPVPHPFPEAVRRGFEKAIREQHRN